MSKLIISLMCLNSTLLQLSDVLCCNILIMSSRKRSREYSRKEKSYKYQKDSESDSSEVDAILESIKRQKRSFAEEKYKRKSSLKGQSTSKQESKFHPSDPEFDRDFYSRVYGKKSLRKNEEDELSLSDEQRKSRPFSRKYYDGAKKGFSSDPKRRARSPWSSHCDRTDRSYDDKRSLKEKRSASYSSSDDGRESRYGRGRSNHSSFKSRRRGGRFMSHRGVDRPYFSDQKFKERSGAFMSSDKVI